MRLNRVRPTYLNQDIHQPSQVLIQLVPLALWDLEQFGDVEEELALLILCEDLALVEEEDAFVEERDALLLLQGLVVEDVGLLNQGRLGQVAVRVLVL